MSDVPYSSQQAADTIGDALPDEERTKRRRGNRMPMADAWYERILGRIGEPPYGFDKLAREVSEKSGESFGKGTIERFVKQRDATDDLLHAFDRMYGVGYPILSAENADEIRWFNIGRLLIRHGYSDLRDVMDRLEAIAVGLATEDEVRKMFGSGQK